jgi:hypothetical protein
VRDMRLEPLEERRRRLAEHGPAESQERGVLVLTLGAAFDCGFSFTRIRGGDGLSADPTA